MPWQLPSAREISALRWFGRIVLLGCAIATAAALKNWKERPIIDPASQVEVEGSLHSVTEQNTLVVVRIVGDETAYEASSIAYPRFFKDYHRVLTGTEPGDPVRLTLDGRRTPSLEGTRFFIGLNIGGVDWLTVEQFAAAKRQNRKAVWWLLGFAGAAGLAFSLTPRRPLTYLRFERAVRTSGHYLWSVLRIGSPLTVLLIVVLAYDQVQEARARKQESLTGDVVKRSDWRTAFVFRSYKLVIRDQESGNQFTAKGGLRLSAAPDRVSFKPIGRDGAFLVEYMGSPPIALIFFVIWLPVNVWLERTAKAQLQRDRKKLIALDHLISERYG